MIRTLQLHIKNFLNFNAVNDNDKLFIQMYKE
jgi:hypothetical protein